MITDYWSSVLIHTTSFLLLSMRYFPPPFSKNREANLFLLYSLQREDELK